MAAATTLSDGPTATILGEEVTAVVSEDRSRLPSFVIKGSDGK